MAHYAVRESPPLRGEIPIGTSKNAVLPIMCGALLTGDDVRIEKPPQLTDVTTLTSLLRACGCNTTQEKDALVLRADVLRNPQDDADVRRMRASVLVLGPLLARLGEAQLRRLLTLQGRDDLLSCLPALMAQHPPLTLGELQINGRDLTAAGLPAGAELGRTLNALHRRVLLGELPNERGALLAAATKMKT